MKKLLSTVCAVAIAASAAVLPVHADKTGTVTDITQFAFDGSPVRKVIYPASMKTIPQNAFCGAAKLEEIEFRGTITEIGEDAFKNTPYGKTMQLPQSTDERTYIPVRFVGEALGVTVNWIDQ